MMRHLPELETVLTDIENVGGVLGMNLDALAGPHRVEVERVLDEIFDRGYQAGYQDRSDEVTQ